MRLPAIILGFLIHSIIFAQTVTIGTSTYNPPFGMAADKQGNFYGFEIELMNDICKIANLECRFKGMDFTRLFTELLAGRIDLSLSAISITPDRQQNFLFSLPYLPSSGQFVTKVGMKTLNFEDLFQKTVGIERGTLFKSFIQQRFGARVRVLEYKNLQDVFTALSNSKVDLVLVDTPTARYWAANNSKVVKTIGPSFMVGTGYGIMALPAQKPLIDAINKALLQIQNDGTYITLYKRYFTTMSQ